MPVLLIWEDVECVRLYITARSAVCPLSLFPGGNSLAKDAHSVYVWDPVTANRGSPPRAMFVLLFNKKKPVRGNLLSSLQAFSRYLRHIHIMFSLCILCSKQMLSSVVPRQISKKHRKNENYVCVYGACGRGVFRERYRTPSGGVLVFYFFVLCFFAFSMCLRLFFRTLL